MEKNEENQLNIELSEDVALGVAMACMEKEEERRVRSWNNHTLATRSPTQQSPSPRMAKASKDKL